MEGGRESELISLAPLHRSTPPSHLGGSERKSRTRMAERKVKPGVIRRPVLGGVMAMAMFVLTQLNCGFGDYDDLQCAGAPPTM